MRNLIFGAAFIAVLSLGCGGSGAEDVASERFGASVVGQPNVAVDCAQIPNLPAGYLEVKIGPAGSETTPYAYELTYPQSILGGTGSVSLVFHDSNTAVDFSVTGYAVAAAIVRSFDTGSMAYVYPDPITADSGLTSPLGEGNRTITRVKLCVVPLEDECTYTQGYWKTHSDQGPAAHPDATWNLLPGGLGEETMFFSSGMTWLEVLQTPPKGNVYFQLAHQYIAARLNVLAGATAPAQLATATTELTAITGTTVPAAKRALFLSLADALTAFNEGTTGPGHCEDEVIVAE